MPSPQYRLHMQGLLDSFVSVLPANWSDAELSVKFHGRVRVALELRVSVSVAGALESVALGRIAIDVGDAARALRAELARGGGADCAGFSARFDRTGKGSFDVQY